MHILDTAIVQIPIAGIDTTHNRLELFGARRETEQAFCVGSTTYNFKQISKPSL